jgi:hypothetical protein
MSADEQSERCRLIVDRVRMLSDPRMNLPAPSRRRKAPDRKPGGPRYLLPWNTNVVTINSQSTPSLAVRCGLLHTLFAGIKKHGWPARLGISLTFA